jgi:hypothetical protein
MAAAAGPRPLDGPGGSGVLFAMPDGVMPEFFKFLPEKNKKIVITL